ncbi:DUF2059 domain-containing protein [Bacteroides sp.]|uniref:DUF2059 domain-containing protein n=1 Tax=Bacteroides sp. TaxID=29523 RepID=UPI0026043AFA|nr:DUF2059 domain-containing protein [Bacteroides sp.]MDD3036541.1 DUF2059 domain-containing protein [Bacteroides sp.]
MRKGLFLAVLGMIMLFATATSVYAQSDDNKEYRDTLEKMMSLSGSLEITKTMVPQMISMMKQSSPGTADAFWDDFAAKWKTKFADRMVELYVPIYQKYLTIDDLKDLIAFYETPIGKKLAEATPKMTMEGMQLGQKIGMEMATELQNELKVQ